MAISGKCSLCGQSSDKLRRCTGKCGGEAAYCSSDCQLKHWKSGHKAQCGKVSKDHEFHSLDGTFHSEIAPYLKDCAREDKVPVTYSANISAQDDGGDDIRFERTRLLPKAAIERAKTGDSDFDYRLCMSIALNYKDQMLAKCDNPRCRECGAPATTIFQTPTVDWSDRKPIIRDIWATPCCTNNDGECLKKRKEHFAGFAEALATKMPKILEKAGIEMKK